ncbi:MAG: 16S rRNA (guanine(966)-N(2))-methyltransferase RsmD [Phycisphaerae bacterium]|nr:16S rRNA (guanine(966)-N(2))-methyltransferase RsmD [Phycisphaerae bacterium]
MRIIAGYKKGMKLFSPRGMDTRPITDRVKESLFNILWNRGRIENCVAADLFCGTGSMGLEALSRGAKWVTFIDGSREVVQILRQNIQKTGFVSQSKAVCANILKVGAAPTPEFGLYDLVFCDPPYEMSTHCGPATKIGRLMELIDRQVNAGGWVILRTHLRAHVEGRYGGLEKIDQREWGSMKIIFFEKTPHAGGGQLVPLSGRQEDACDV